MEMNHNPSHLQRISDIVKGLQDKTIAPKSLPMLTRLRCLEYLIFELQTSQMEAADILGVARSTIQRYLARLKSIAVSEIAPFETERIAKEFVAAGRMVQAMCLKQGKLDLWWKIEVDIVEQLGALGFIRFNAGGPTVEVKNTIITGNRPNDNSDIHLLTPEQKERLRIALRAAGFGPKPSGEGDNNNGRGLPDSTEGV